MNYNHLFYFYTTAKLGGVSKAAQFLHISQPSLSMQIKTFEEHVGKHLFQKAGRGIQLTSDGERAYRYCQKIFEAVDDFQTYLKGTNLEPSKLRIGISEQIESPFVADLFATVYQKNEKFNSVAQLTSGAQNQLLEQLRLQQIDMVLTNSLVYNSEFQIRADVNMPMGLFISRKKFKEHFHSENLKITFKQMLSEMNLDFILPSPRQRLRQEIDIFLQRFAIKNSIILESDVLSVVARSLVDGLGIGFLPIPYVAEEIKLKLLTPLFPKENFWNHKFYVVCRRQEKLDPLLEKLILTIASLEKKPHFFGKKLKN